MVDLYKQDYKKEKINVFEIGCGYGGNLYPFFQNGENVAGCDYN